MISETKYLKVEFSIIPFGEEQLGEDAFTGSVHFLWPVSDTYLPMRSENSTGPFKTHCWNDLGNHIYLSKGVSGIFIAKIRSQAYDLMVNGIYNNMIYFRKI